MKNSKNMGKLSFKLIKLVRTGTETNARSRTDTMTHQKCIFWELFYFLIIYILNHNSLYSRRFHLVSICSL